MNILQKQNLLEMIFGEKNESVADEVIKKELGIEGFQTYSAVKTIKQFIGITQARMPFEIIID